MKRGIVTFPCSFKEISNGNGFTTRDELSAIDINYYTLYWDSIIISNMEMFHFPIPNEEELISCGVIERPILPIKYPIHSGDIPNQFLSSQSGLLDYLRKEQKGTDWRLHQKGDTFVSTNEQSKLQDILRLELTNALPVPGNDVPLCDILEFKMRRADELSALHIYLEELYKEVMTSHDFHLARASAYSRLVKAIQDINSLNNEGWRTPFKINITASFETDVNSILTGALSAYTAASLTDAVTTVLTGIGGFVLGGLKLNPVRQRVLNGNSGSLVYLSNASKENITA
ncbi:DUF6236 family protein [Serratia sp. JSRIV006]|uniref:DUF6236 family protein n=1 Tax=Serratia sp. JSRIV006 TaxID=2831896 RepID=UPI001CBC4037|nr:DUF6236 family protein [Serratia sp. JSRIV006]UAN61553.1 hypothetical protein KGP16_18310 [Serratia sp. JSRIV006]